MKASWITLLLSSATLLAGCFADSASDPTNETNLLAEGEAVYRTPLEDGNSFACATCHALSEPAADGFLRPGHPIGDAFFRSSYKNGQTTDLREAVNTCVTEWMNGNAWTAGDERWQALSAFLEAQAPNQTADPITIEIVDPPADLTGGDIPRGQDFFNGACAVCHGQNADGTLRGPPLKGGRELSPELIAGRVRRSGRTDSNTYNGLTGGIMPFWGANRISDDELLDVISYVNMISRETTNPDPDPDPDPDPNPNPGDCTSDHPKVGQVAQLRNFSHDIGGQAIIVDDCTIRIENFTFDGAGINVQLYGATGGDYDNGFSMSGDLRRAGGYNGETLTFTLPEGRTLDDVDGVSVWCVPVGVSFGDGLFTPQG